MAVTIKDVAKKAGTSTATVSKVMNGSYSISSETVERVEQVMRELNYHPNQRARNFARQSNKTIAFLTALGRNTGFQNPHMFEMMCGIEATLTRKGYSLIVKSVEESEAPEYVRAAIEQKEVDGFLIHASVISHELDAMITEHQIPHLVIGNPSFESNLCWIDVDNKHAGQVAAKYLLTMGYQAVAYIGGKEEDKISMHRLDGVLSILKAHDAYLPMSYLQYGDSDCDTGYAMTEQILKSKTRPEAIICANNYLAFGCMRALQAQGIKVPEDMGVLTFDDYPFSQILSPQLTVVNIDVYEMGEEAGKLILQKVKKPNMHMQSYITYPAVIERASTKKHI